MIDFKINQDFIAKTLCINRKKPLSSCKGKCYLSKQLKKAEEKEDKKSTTTKEKQLEIVCYFSKNSFNYPLYKESFISQIQLSYVANLDTSSFIFDIFHPPKLNLI